MSCRLQPEILKYARQEKTDVPQMYSVPQMYLGSGAWRGLARRTLRISRVSPEHLPSISRALGETYHFCLAPLCQIRHHFGHIIPNQEGAGLRSTSLPNAAGYYLAKPESHTPNPADYYKPFLANYIFRVPIYLEATVFETESSKPCLA